MKEKDKAYELIAGYRYTLSLPNAPLGDDKDRVAKQCALICVDEMLEALEDSKEYVDDNSLFEFNNKILKYWQTVKTEIEAL